MPPEALTFFSCSLKSLMRQEIMRRPDIQKKVECFIDSLVEIEFEKLITERRKEEEEKEKEALK